MSLRPSPIMGECWNIPGTASYSGFYLFSNRYLLISFIILFDSFITYIPNFLHSDIRFYYPFFIRYIYSTLRYPFLSVVLTTTD
jgi:hypothetical protein